MNRNKAAMIVVVLGGALGACQQGQDQKPAASAPALEQRIAALEQQQAPPSPVAGAVGVARRAGAARARDEREPRTRTTTTRRQTASRPAAPRPRSRRRSRWSA